MEELSPSSAQATSGGGLLSLEAIVLLFSCRPIADHLGTWKFNVHIVRCSVLCFACYGHFEIIISGVTDITIMLPSMSKCED